MGGYRKKIINWKMERNIALYRCESEKSKSWMMDLLLWHIAVRFSTIDRYVSRQKPFMNRNIGTGISVYSTPLHSDNSAFWLVSGCSLIRSFFFYRKTCKYKTIFLRSPAAYRDLSLEVIFSLFLYLCFLC